MERLAGLAAALALKWDKSPDEIVDEVEAVEVEVDDVEVEV